MVFTTTDGSCGVVVGPEGYEVFVDRGGGYEEYVRTGGSGESLEGVTELASSLPERANASLNPDGTIAPVDDGVAVRSEVANEDRDATFAAEVRFNFEAGLREAMSSQGRSEAQIQCVLGELRHSLSDVAIEEDRKAADAGRQRDDTVRSAVAAAIAGCPA